MRFSLPQVTIPLGALWFAAAAVAHQPEGVTYPLFQFADDQVPVMDGDLSDWEILPPESILDFNAHVDVVNEPPLTHDMADLHIVRAAVGWNDKQNLLYFMAEIYDDSLLFYKEDPDSLDSFHSRLTGDYVHGSDIWEIVIDADHGAEPVRYFSENPQREMRYRSAFTQNYHLYIPPLNGYYWWWLYGKSSWARDEKYSKVGWKTEAKHEQAGTVTYECYLTPFDDLHPDGPEQSEVHDLQEGDIIGLSWAFLDRDPGGVGFWSLSHTFEMCCQGDNQNDFRLMPLQSK